MEYWKSCTFNMKVCKSICAASKYNGPFSKAVVTLLLVLDTLKEPIPHKYPNSWRRSFGKFITNSYAVYSHESTERQIDLKYEESI